MLKWLRGARVDWKTGIVVIVLALAVWAFVVYVGVRAFVPGEITQPPPRNLP
jgi:hypothetical protein